MTAETFTNLLWSKEISKSLAIAIVDCAGGRRKCPKWSTFSVKPKIDAGGGNSSKKLLITTNSTLLAINRRLNLSYMRSSSREKNRILYHAQSVILDSIENHALRVISRWERNFFGAGILKLDILQSAFDYYARLRCARLASPAGFARLRRPFSGMGEVYLHFYVL